MNFDETFKEESKEHLSLMQESLMNLESFNEHDTDAISREVNTIFRSIHTIKGSAGMVGYDHISYFAHHIESLLDQVRILNLALNDEMVEVLLQCGDHLQQLLDEDLTTDLKLESERFVQKVTAFSEQPSVPADSVLQTDESQTKKSQQTAGCWHLVITPHRETFVDGFDCLPILKELNDLGQASFFSSYKIEEVEEFDPLTCYLSISVIIEGSVSKELIEQAFMFVEDDWNIDISTISPDEDVQLGSLLSATGTVQEEQILKIEESKKKLGEELNEQGLVSKGEVSKALEQQAFVREKNSHQLNDVSLKVSANKMESLMNLIGELVIVQSSVAQIAHSRDDEEFGLVSEELTRLTTEVRDTVFGMRMLPIGSIFGRFKRLVRDLNKSLGKQVELKTSGSETELDKVVLEKISDPLIHIIRNSMDHGIELPDTRAAKGKPEKGTISLSASHKDGQVLIQIQDDGAGLNAEKIFKKALDVGIVSEDSQLSESEIHELIFAPGFSTAGQVSDVSGRGVGMDVVKSSIEALRGSISIESQENAGMTLRLWLPLTMAIIDGLMVKVGDEYFIIPLNIIDECIETQTVGSHESDIHLVRTRGKIIPAARLSQVFDVDHFQQKFEQTVIVNVGDEKLGITIDEIVGQHQTVIKSLGKLYRHVSGLLGGTILGNGEVAMILDVPKLYEDIQPKADELLKKESCHVN